MKRFFLSGFPAYLILRRARKRNAYMEEIKIDESEVEQLRLTSVEFNELIKKSGEGAQIGLPWNRKVFEYFFESGLGEDQINAIMTFATFGYFPEDEDGYGL